MNLRTVTLGAGAAVTTFLLVGAGTIELLGAGEAPGIGIIGVAVGLFGGLLVGVAVAVAGDRLSGLPSLALVGYATFGVAFVAVAGMRYVNVPGADELFTFPVHLGVSVGAAVIVAVLAARGEAGESSAPVSNP